MRIWPIIVDGFREATAGWVFPLLVVLAILPSLVCLGIGYEELDTPRLNTQTVHQVMNFPKARNIVGNGGKDIIPAMRFLWGVHSSSKATNDDPRQSFKIAPSVWLGGNSPQPLPATPDLTIDGISPSDYISKRLAEAGVGEDIEVKPVEGSIDEIYTVTMKPRPSAGFTVFSTGPFPTGKSTKELVTRVRWFVAKTLGGSIGVLIALIITASFIPDLQRKGRLEIFLSKPISRTTLLLGKYLGAVLFVLVIASVLMTTIWFTTAIRSGFWDIRFLMSIFVFTFLFALLYTISVLAGIVTRNTIASGILTVCFWWICSLTGTARQFFQLIPVEEFSLKDEVTMFLDILYWVLPKTGDLDYLTGWLILDRESTPLLYWEMRPFMEKINFGWSVMTSTLFCGVILGLAIWKFRRRDY